MFAKEFNPLFALIALVAALPVSVDAQEPQAYKLVPTTVYEKQPVKKTKWVDETVMEKQTVTKQKMVWQTETRQRRQVTYKPVHETAEREERVVVRKPVMETLFREKRTEQTTYENVTEMRDQQYTVRKPVVETQIREEQVTVRKPVTEKLIEVKATTTYKPVVRSQTQMVQTETVVPQVMNVPDPNARPRMQRLQRGYYTNPATCETEFRRRGLHWVQPTVAVPAATTVPTLVPQQVDQVDYVPETIETRRPVEITRFVEQVETRKVPVQVERMIEETAIRQVPVTVKVPTTKVTVEQVPYTKTTYVEEVTVRKIPYTKKSYQKVETVESYDVEVPRWIDETTEVEVPRTVSRRVEYEVMQEVPRTIMMKVPIDACGNEIAGAVYEQPTSSSLESEFSPADGTTTSRKVGSDSGEVILSEGESTNTEGYQGELQVVPKTLDETSERSVLVPDTTPTAKNPGTELQSIAPPPNDSTTVSKAADAKAADAEAVDAKAVDANAVDANAVEETSGRVVGGDANAKPDETIGKADMPEDSPTETGDEGAAERPPVPQGTESAEPK